MEVMTPRQRVLTAKVESPFGPASDIAWVEPEVLSILGVDFIRVHAKGPKKRPIQVNAGGTIIDEWGITRRQVDVAAGIYYIEMVGHPMKDAGLEDLAGYPWHDPYDDISVRLRPAKAKYDSAN